MGTEDDAEKMAREAVVKSSTELVKQGYTDLLHPAAQEVGQILQTGGSLLRLLTRPLRTLLDTGHAMWDRLDAHLRQRLQSEPQDQIVDPPPHVSGPLLLAYPFVEPETELRQLLVELLAKSMLVDSKPTVHPAFVEILKQLSPDEARMLPILGRTHLHPSLRVAYTYTPAPSPPPPLPQNTAPFGQRPTVELEDMMEAMDALEKHRQQSQERGWIGTVLISAFAEMTKLDHPNTESVERALGNLERLALIQIEASVMRSEARDPYEAVRNSSTMKEFEAWATGKGLFFEPHKATIIVTAFGRQFLVSCLPPGSTPWSESPKE